MLLVKVWSNTKFESPNDSRMKRQIDRTRAVKKKLTKGFLTERICNDLYENGARVLR